MTERDIRERVGALLRQADRFRLPGHRHTADLSLEQFDEIRDGLRRLNRDLRPAEVPRTERRTPTPALFPARDRRSSGFVVEHRTRARV